MQDNDSNLLMEQYQKICEMKGDIEYKTHTLNLDNIPFEKLPEKVKLEFEDRYSSPSENNPYYVMVEYSAQHEYKDDSDYDRETGYGYLNDPTGNVDDVELNIRVFDKEDNDIAFINEENGCPSLYNHFLEYAKQNSEAR